MTRSRDTIYAEIIRAARRRIAAAQMRADRDRAAAEAAHLDAIPPVLNCSDDRKHRHYLAVERPRFIRACVREMCKEFEPLWAELEAMTPPLADGEATPPLPADGPIRLNYQSLHKQ